jgi:hypothetical protein
MTANLACAIIAPNSYKKFISVGRSYTVTERKGLRVTVIDNFGMNRTLPITVFMKD